MPYYVTTWDIDEQRWTPQIGVPVGPYTQFGLRTALRELNSMGYDTSRRGGNYILVEDEATYRKRHAESQNRL